MAAAPLQRRSFLLRTRLLLSRSSLISQTTTKTRSLSSDALVEMHPGEIGTVSGIPQEHLSRKVLSLSLSILSDCKSARLWESWKVEINFMSTQKWENPLMAGLPQGIHMPMSVMRGLVLTVKRLQKHLLRSMDGTMYVKKRHTPLLRVKAYADNFKWKGPPKSED
ncbi:NADH dehydrogenase [ubiquinone] iron-sulfur protein 4, mitochondrial-like [Iris pallida]|uniref:NADH dehydrogenase [ubiquinone] iron-sulfur protein 4, mitochondrial-like n=1 Tax=Iris pallida TaxID=29817 RepID=A0AAX6GHH9_IRIPA|nr:NADH dehydrogenase [ubiquinone] iron-sulfur protein 4, mitochondrial-like [Iris pallida]